MKKLIFLIFIGVCSIIVFGQIDKNLTKADWKVGKVKKIFDHQITRVQGRNDARGMINVAYKNLNQLNDELATKAKKESWTEDQISTTKTWYSLRAKGGMVSIYITRKTHLDISPKLFNIVVKTKRRKEVYSTQLASESVEPQEGANFWWNYHSFLLPYEMKEPFYVYVTDAMGGRNSRYRFLVEPNQE